MNYDYEALSSMEFQDQDARDSTESIDGMVQRNIQEVLQAAELEESTSRLSIPERHGGNPGSSSSFPASRERPLSRTASRGGGAARGSAAEDTGLCQNSTVLDVPGHAEATIRLHKARIQGLEGEVAKLTKGFNEKEHALSEATKELKLLRSEQAAWSKNQKVLEAKVEKYRKAAMDAETAQKALQNELKDLAREGNRGNKDMKAVEAESRSRDARLTRALEEVERYKKMLQELKSQERECKDVAKSDYNKVVQDNKKLERQRAELVVAFRKQLKLIDILKRQKVHLEASRALQFTEQEFLQTLEMGQG